MITHIKSLYQARDLLWAWTGRTIRGRYQQSALGWLWAIIQPAATAAIFSLIFTLFIPVDTGDIPYVVFSYAAVVPWALLSTSLMDMTISLVQNMSLVTKIYFPRETLPIAALLARLMDFGIAFGLLLLLIWYFQVPVEPMGLLYLPVILGIQLLLVMGLGLAGAALNIFYRDVQAMLTLGIQIWFYASPIIYPVTLVPEYLRDYYLIFNPMAGILEAYRAILLHNTLPGPYLALSGGIAFIIFMAGYGLFKRFEYQFADIV